MSEQLRVYKYKPYKKTVTVLSPDGSKREEKVITVKDAYIMIKSNGDSIVGDEKLMRSLGINVAGVVAEFAQKSTNSNIIEEDDDKTDAKPTQPETNPNKNREGLTKV